MAWILFFRISFGRKFIDKNGGKKERGITLLKSLLAEYCSFTRVSGQFQGRILKTSLPTTDFDEN
jgi:hypothetical protein